MRVVTRIGKLTFDGDSYTKTAHRNMTQLWRDATKAFLNCVIQDGLIRVETGMSKASLLPLARAVRMLTTVRASIDPRIASRKGYTGMGGTYHPGQERSIEHGIQLGEDAYDLDYGSVNNMQLKFEFRITVFQFLIHENGLFGFEAMKALDAGRAAFTSYIKDNKAEYIPKIKNFLKVSNHG